ncbi:hypothetical protein F5Y14DRAFT_427295 [Nemania sp. NC0429]|nr:hypothetical protein F5Y14DRAFT_427295 [Nemania sp. NC0429]
MDRKSPETGAVLTTKPNGRISNIQPAGNRRLARKTSGNLDFKENSIASDTDGRRVSAIPRSIHDSIRRHRQSESLIEPRVASPSPSVRTGRGTPTLGTPRHLRDTRIPRPATTGPFSESHSRDRPQNHGRNPSPSQPRNYSSPMRQPMDIKAAFRRAQEQAAAEANTDSENTLDLQEAFNMANAEFDGIRRIDGSPSPAPRPFRREPKTTLLPRNRTDGKGSDLNMHLQQFDHSHQLASADAPRNLFAKNRIASTAQETGHPVRKGSSEGNPGRDADSLMPVARGTGPRSHEKVEGNGAPTSIPLSTSTYPGESGVDIPVPSIEYTNAIDDRPSPEIHPANRSPEKSMNWHLDADFTAGDLEFSATPRITTKKTSSGLGYQTGTPLLRRSRLSQIQERELEAARTAFPEDTPAIRQTNHKLDEIKAREMEALSRRAVASSRLDEIRIKNSEPRAESPELRKDLFKKPTEDGSAQPDTDRKNPHRPSPSPESRTEAIHGTPILVLKNSGEGTLGVSNQGSTAENNKRGENLLGKNPYDSLPHLTRLISPSPRETVKGVGEDSDAPRPRINDIKQASEGRKLTRSTSPTEERRVQNPGIKDPKDRPTVGFIDLKRMPSSDSLQEKRSSRTTSEVDPTDRITAELNLFAPLDNYSERGSMRAPSPVPSEPKDEETPRPPKIDPLTQPTPRVTGAYVDTPATVRVRGVEGRTNTGENPLIAREMAVPSQGQTTGLSPTKNLSSPVRRSRVNSLKQVGSRSSSMPSTSRRSRSSSRRRRPLINTAKPPTVKDDIIAILRANKIDDSTLENLDSILDREFDDLKLKELVNDTVLKVEDDPDIKFSEMSDRERELEALDRMGKSLETGLLGIRSAKKGIERLEDKVTHNGSKDNQPRRPSNAQSPTVSSLSPSEAGPTVLPVPRLYRRNPKFKLTTFGIITICAVIWYGLECAFCFLYGGPEYICTPAVPCDWSPNEPYFPYTMPFMLDEWATGGKGRQLVWKAGEEIGDMFAEVSDWVTNTDFTQFDERYMDVWQRKRHRRRLRKRASAPKWTEPPGYRARFPVWQAAQAARELAYELGEDESMSADERVW